MSQPGAGAAFPNPSTAFTLAATALFVSFLLPGLFGGGIAAAAIGSALGLGGLGILTARLVPEPVSLRLGMTPFPLRALAPVALLIPVAFLVSELDNWIRLALAASPSAGLGTPSLPATEAVVLGVFLEPVLEEFFFRGVLLQGCVASLGRWRGLSLVAALQIVLLPSLLIIQAFAGEPMTAAIASKGASTLALGILLGLLRLASGSLLPGMVLSGSIAALSFAAGAFPDRVAIAGFNAPGDTTPLAVLAPATLCVALGTWLLVQQLALQPELPPIPPQMSKDEEGPGSLF
jgi:membrane protease YdiL (CAAX protease family)